MRRVVSSFVLVVVMVAGCSSSSKPTVIEKAPTCTTGQVYTAAAGDHAFCIPAGWTLETKNDFQAKWFIFAPSDGPNDAFRENMNLQLAPGANTPDLDSLAKTQTQALKDAFTTFHDLGTTVTHLGSQPARTLHYTATLDDTSVEGRQTMSAVNGHVYIVTYTEAPGDDSHRAEAQSVLTTFRFLA